MCTGSGAHRCHICAGSGAHPLSPRGSVSKLRIQKRSFTFRTATTSLRSRAAVPRSLQLLLHMPDNGGHLESRYDLVTKMYEWVGKRV
jgi:hypothetical protein